MPKSSFDATCANLTSRYKVAAIASCRFNIRQTSAANTAQADLHDARDMRHLPLARRIGLE